MTAADLSRGRLYGILDLSYVDSLEAGQVTEQMIAGGIDLIQLRAKTCPAAEIAKIRQVYGHFDADLFWERITYFLERVVPVANQYKIKLAQHPHDPGLPPADDGEIATDTMSILNR